MSFEKKYKDETWLQEKYWEEELSQREISELCDRSRKTIGRWMDKYDIEVRDHDEANSIAQQNCSGKHRDEEWLREMYVENGLGVYDVGYQCGCNHETVRTWLHKRDIDVRKPHDTQDVDCKALHRDEKWLREKYSGGELVLSEMASICGCSDATINNWLEKYGIEKRSFSETVLTCDMKHESEEWIKEKYISEDNTIGEISDMCGCSDTVIRRKMNEYNIEVEDQLDCLGLHRKKSWLEKKYKERGMTTTKISDLCGCTQETISKWLLRYEIETNSGTFECGEDHWNYKNGGKMRENVDFRKNDKWKNFSHTKKGEAGWSCEYCGGGGTLHTHHCDPISMGGNKWDNDFVVLCKDCHIGDYYAWHPPLLEEYIE